MIKLKSKLYYTITNIPDKDYTQTSVYISYIYRNETLPSRKPAKRLRFSNCLIPILLNKSSMFLLQLPSPWCKLSYCDQ